jgi:hypothetical protein
MFFMAVSSLFIGAPAHAQDFSALKSTGRAQVIEVITPYTVQLDNGQIVRLSGVHFPDYDAENPGELSITALQILKDMLSRKEVRVFQTPKGLGARESDGACPGTFAACGGWAVGTGRPARHWFGAS